jgi:hypothetical protein
VDTSRAVGLDSLSDETPVRAYKTQGTIYSGTVKDKALSQAAACASHQRIMQLHSICGP